jgi:transcriptional regulator with XRE-family HTH domain
VDNTARAIRDARLKAGLSLRELGGRTGVSASLLSQIETGRARPSVTTLYALVGELGLSLDELVASDNGHTKGALSLDRHLEELAAQPIIPGESPVKRPSARPVLELESGVVWEQLARFGGAGTDAILVTYPPGSSSSTTGRLSTHTGFEIAYLISGTLELQLEFETYTVSAGDSIAFDSSRVHVYRNTGTEAALGVWFVIGRGHADS